MTTNSYKFGGGTQKPLGAAVSGVLPEGDYTFTVLECTEPYLNDNGRWVLKVKLSIPPDDHWVWAAPWSGETDAHEERDGIGDFLLAVNRATAVGKEPDYRRVIGAKGRCRLKLGKDNKDRERNEVAYFHTPKEVGTSASAFDLSSGRKSVEPPKQERRPKTYSQEERNEAQRVAEKNARGKDPDLDTAPDDIPF
jgi:hypothetical protein